MLDLGLGDIFSVRMAGNGISSKVLGSMEYGCAVAKAKLILVMGHTRCGTVTASVDLACSDQTTEAATGCQHLGTIVHEIQLSLDVSECVRHENSPAADKAAFVDVVARRNVERIVGQIVSESQTISDLVARGRLAVVGAMYDVATGTIDFYTDSTLGLKADEMAHADPA